GAFGTRPLGRREAESGGGGQRLREQVARRQRAGGQGAPGEGMFRRGGRRPARHSGDIANRRVTAAAEHHARVADLARGPAAEDSAAGGGGQVRGPQGAGVAGAQAPAGGRGPAPVAAVAGRVGGKG